MSVQKEFRKPGLEAQLLNRGGKKPVLFSLIHFASCRNAIKSFMGNLAHMRITSANEEESENSKKPDAAVVQLLFNSSFIESTKGLLILLDPIAELINICQKDDTSAADAVQKWLQLQETAPNELKTILKNRCEKSNVYNKYTLTANFFHPVYRGKKLSQAQMKIVDDFIFDSLDGDALESCRQFKAEEGVFAALKPKKIVSPKTYWFYAGQQGNSELAKFANKLLKIPSSTAQLERLFSNWSFVHSEVRNRLLPETSKKLINIYFTLRATDSIIEEEDEDIEEE